MSQIKYLKTNFGLFFLLKIYLILTPCCLKQFMYEQGILI